MRGIYLLILSVLLVGCGNTSSQQETVPVLEGTYQITQVGDFRISDPDLTMNFDVEEERMSGNAGCNNFSSSFQQNESSIDFTRPISTKMYCEGNMEIEDQLFRLLDSISSVRSSNGQIELFSPDNQTLVTLRKQE